MVLPSQISGERPDSSPSDRKESAATGKLPNARKPKARPPRGLRDKYFLPVKSLPTYTGPYSVGTMEIEVPARDPRTFSHIKRDGRHVLELETVLMTIYYPAARETHTTLPPGKDKKWSRQLWLGRPRIEIAKGAWCMTGRNHYCPY